MLRVYLGILSAVAMLLLSVIYPLRVCCRNQKGDPNTRIKRMNRQLRKVHKYLGAAVILLAVSHGVLAFQRFGIPEITGVLAFLLLMLAGFTWLFRKRLKKRWLLLHRVFAGAIWPLMIAHVLLQF